MTIHNGNLANEDNFNGSFLSKKDNDSLKGKLTLDNTELESGAKVDNAQAAINKLFSATGVTGEVDSSSNVYTDPKYIANGDSYKESIEKLDAQLYTTDTHESRIVTLEASSLDHENRIITLEDEMDLAEGRLGVIESDEFTFEGNKTFSDNVVIQGNLTINGTTTSVNTTDMEVTDRNITVNKGGNDLTAEGAGLTVERTGANGFLEYDDDLTSKWKLGKGTDVFEVLVTALNQVITGIKNFTSGLLTDTIDESTTDAGVTIESVLLKDGLVDGRDVSQDGTEQDTHIADDTIHFTEASIDHANIQNIGTNSHDDIDSHIASTSNPHGVTQTQVGLSDVTNDAQLKRAAADYNSFSEKSAINVDDLFLIEDSEDSLAKKKIKASALMSGGGSAYIIHTFKANGWFSTGTGIDGIFVLPFDAVLKNVIISQEVTGSSGNTTIDIKRKDQGSGSFATIFSTVPSINFAAGSNAWVMIGQTVANTTAPVLTTPNLSCSAGQGFRMDITSKQGGSPAEAQITLVFEKV